MANTCERARKIVDHEVLAHGTIPADMRTLIVAAMKVCRVRDICWRHADMQLNRDLIDHLEARGEATVPALLDLRRRLKDAEGDQLPLFAVPLALDPPEHALLIDTAIRLCDALADAALGVFGGLEEAMRRLRVHPAAAPFIRAEIPRNIRLARCDFLHSRDGWRSGEINLSGGVGGLTVRDFDDVIRTDPFLAGFIAEHGLTNISPPHVLASTVREYCDSLEIAEHPTVALIDWQGFEVNHVHEHARIMDAYREQGFDTMVCHHREAVYREGRLWCRGRPVDVVHRAFLLEDLPTDPDSALPVLDAAADGAVVLISTFRDEWYASKAAFATLHEACDRGLLPPETVRMVAELVPRTWLLVGEDDEDAGERWTVSPRDVAGRDPREVVLKPVIGSNSLGVVLGADTEPEVFRAAVDLAAHDELPYVIQEFIPPGPVPFPCLGDDITVTSQQVSAGVYLAGGQFAGMRGWMLPDGRPRAFNFPNGAILGTIWSPR